MSETKSSQRRSQESPLKQHLFEHEVRKNAKAIQISSELKYESSAETVKFKREDEATAKKYQEENLKKDQDGGKDHYGSMVTKTIEARPDKNVNDLPEQQPSCRSNDDDDDNPLQYEHKQDTQLLVNLQNADHHRANSLQDIPQQPSEVQLPELHVSCASTPSAAAPKSTTAEHVTALKITGYI